MKRTVLLATLVLAVAPAAAGAVTYDQPLPVKSSNPADGGRIDPISTPVPWEILGSLKNTESSLSIEVSTQNTLGPDGTLDDASVIDTFALYTFQGSGDFTGQSVGGKGRWQDTPGTYYWMASAEVHEDPDNFLSPAHYYRSKVFTIRVGGPAGGTTSTTSAQPVTPAQLPPVKPSPTSAKTSARLHTRSIVHGHAKLLAQCSPAPCTLRTISFAKIGKKWYAGRSETKTLANTALQRLYVGLPARTLRAVRQALKRHRRVTFFVAVDTVDPSGAVVDREPLSFRLTRVVR